MIEKSLSELTLKELARKMHYFESQENDIDFMKCADEVNRRGEELKFREIYTEVWKEMRDKIERLHRIFHK